MPCTILSSDTVKVNVDIVHSENSHDGEAVCLLYVAPPYVLVRGVECSATIILEGRLLGALGTDKIESAGAVPVK